MIAVTANYEIVHTFFHAVNALAAPINNQLHCIRPLGGLKCSCKTKYFAKYRGVNVIILSLGNDVLCIDLRLVLACLIRELYQASIEVATHMIFDCPPGFTAASVSALMAAREVVIPMLVDGFSMWGVHDMAEQINGIRSANLTIKIAGVLITQWHNCELVRQGEILLRKLSLPVFKTVIRRTDKVPESTIDRRSIYDYSPRSAASRDYQLWVQEYLGEEVGQHG